MLEVEKKSTSIIAESFRKLKTNIQYSSLDKKCKVIAITSSKPGEGKTFVSSNLALTLSEGNRKVILIDCDFRNPNIHRKFNISNITGLSETLLDKENFNIAIRKYSENFVIITSGNMPPNPSETLASERMAEFLEELKEKYDYIILDTPPLLVVSDPQVISIKADGTILVVRVGNTKKYEIQESYKILKSINANVVGTILNGMKNEDKKYYGKYYVK
ncbi:CpsD/CapB family tyrosine-protein kinase [Clostridium sp. AL.422]|uniref:CpsD/CapB family tyrosine-protein kinase n=1 Tax=Clostridium TaxID=1485 RepID=UPI00293DC8A2|nr:MULTISPECIES: CpsD/CapB family tyrosine-protein kinase [unclassified Clostridium]MDV4150433.1 CpsD/CapB family tyrosine-protein kinase [Clostridium sp. AL.422]